MGTGSLASQGGSSSGCSIPGFSNNIAQVQAVALAFTAVNPAGSGYISVNAADQTLAGSVATFQTADLPTNTSQVAVAQTSGVGDIKVLVAFSSTHVVIRAVGYYSKPVQTVPVHPVPGDHTASGTALLNALAGITNASATKHYVIKLEPGIYDVGSTELAMKTYVDLEGSGQGATLIQGSGFATPDSGVIRGAASAELRDLQVKSTGTGSQSAVAVYVPEGADTRIRNVTIAASGNAGVWGIRAAGGSPWIEEVTIRPQGGTSVYGIVGLGTSLPTVKRTVIEVTGGSTAGHGMFFATLGSPDLRDVQITVTGSGTSYGIRILEPGGIGGLRLTNSTITAEDFGIDSGSTGLIYIENSQVRATDTSSSYGVSANVTTVTVDHSEISGATSTVSAFNVFVGATRLHGGAVAAATSVCAGVYDESFTFFAGPACP